MTQIYVVNCGQIETWLRQLHVVLVMSSGASRGAPQGVATLKVRKGAFDVLNKGSGALGKVKLSPPRGRPPEELYDYVVLESRKWIAEAAVAIYMRLAFTAVTGVLMLLGPAPVKIALLNGFLQQSYRTPFHYQCWHGGAHSACNNRVLVAIL